MQSADRMSHFGSFITSDKGTSEKNTCTSSMEQSPWEANRFSASQEIPRILEPQGSLPRLEVPATCRYAEPDQSSPWPHPTSWRSISILSFHLRLVSSKWFLSLRFAHQNPVCTSLLLHTCYVPRPFHPRFDSEKNIEWWTTSFPLLFKC